VVRFVVVVVVVVRVGAKVLGISRVRFVSVVVVVVSTVHVGNVMNVVVLRVELVCVVGAGFGVVVRVRVRFGSVVGCGGELGVKVGISLSV